MNVGNWVRRSGQKWHLVESVVSDRAVTRCGREMHRVTAGGELEVSVLMPLTRMIGQPQLCKGGCEARTLVIDADLYVAPAEDDATTAPVDPT